jgi:3-isopropylmalate/(R)-2-methylmalate dehydratase large subunit
MGMTLTEKLLSHKYGKKVVQGEYILLEVDVALANDITAPIAIEEFYKTGLKKVFSPEQIVLVPDHFVPNKDIRSAMQVKMIREFAREQGIEKFFELGRMGIEHVLLPEQGIVKSGDIVVGADSHTCTYGALGAFATGVGSTDIAGVYMMGKAWFKVPEVIDVYVEGKFKKNVSGKDFILKLISLLGVSGANYKAIEFRGPGLKNISMDSRFTISNMAIEAGGKTGIFPIDDIAFEYEKARSIIIEKISADEDANYVRRIKINLGEIEPQVALPFLPSNSKDISEVEKGKIKIDQVVIGSCTNGRMEDLRAAASVLKGKKIDKSVRCIIIPGSQQVYKDAMREGLFDIFVDANCAVSTPTCGPCLGGHMGVLARGEVAISTTNRNFIGRMGHTESKVYLSSPVVAAASGIKGYISSPESL